jgi:hypothetical protein
MKITLEFDDEKKALVAMKGLDAYLALTEIRDKLRAIYKYEELTEDQSLLVDRIRDMFSETLDSYHIALDELD